MQCKAFSQATFHPFTHKSPSQRIEGRGILQKLARRRNLGGSLPDEEEKFRPALLPPGWIRATRRPQSGVELLEDGRQRGDERAQEPTLRLQIVDVHCGTGRELAPFQD